MAIPYLPPKVRPGDPIRAQDYNALIDAVRRNTPVAGSCVRVSSSAAGSKIDALPAGKAAKTKDDIFHFKMEITKSDESGSGGGSGSGSESSSETKCVITSGIVQIGGYTYFVEGGELDIEDDGVFYICVKVDLSDGSGSFDLYDTKAALKTAQDDMDYYIFPIYKVEDGVKTVDYRPMPNAGCWESAPPSVSSGS